MTQDEIRAIAQQAYEEVMKQSLRPQDKEHVIAVCTRFLATINAKAEPVARLHIRLEDDGLEARVEVLNGERLQVSDSPVNVFLHPAIEPAQQEPLGVTEGTATPAGAAPLPDDVAKMVKRLRESHCHEAADMLERLARERDQAVIRRDEIAHSLRREEVERLARQVPPDCAVVPREPTGAMVDAVLDERLNALIDSRPHTLVDIYKAMIAAGEVKP